jgi:hypothetical protein
MVQRAALGAEEIPREKIRRALVGLISLKERTEAAR